jgi:hypothetical protein
VISLRLVLGNKLIRNMKKLERFNIGNLKIGVTPDLVFNEGVRLLNREKLKLIDLRDFAFSRINAEEEARKYLHSNGTYVRQSVLFCNGNPAVFLSGSILLEYDFMLDKAVSAQARQEEFFISPEYYDKVYQVAQEEKNEEPEKRVAFIVGEKELEYADSAGNLFIPTKNFEEIDLTRWFYKYTAGSYGKLLHDSKTKEMPVWFPKDDYLSNVDKPFLRQVWVCCLKGPGGVKGDSGVSANNRSLHETSKLIGIMRE